MKPYFKFSLLALTVVTTACSSGGGSSSNNTTSKVQPSVKVQEPAKVQEPTKVQQEQPIKPVIEVISDIQYQDSIKKFVVKSDKLAFTPNETFDSVTLSAENSDTGMNILKLDPTAINKGHGSVKHFVDGDKHLYLRNNETNGWLYQSFGRYVDINNRDMALISVGENTREIPLQGSATYTGIAMGDAMLNGDYAAGSGEIVSNVKVDVDFANKTLKFASSDTKGLTENKEIVDYNNFNLTGSAKWNGAESKFMGSVSTSAGETGKLEGAFYGPKAEEIGGTFDVKGATQEYQGGFGAKQ